MIECEYVECRVDEGEIICWDSDERVEIHSNNMVIDVSGILKISATGSAFSISSKHLYLDIDESGAIKIYNREK